MHALARAGFARTNTPTYVDYNLPGSGGGKSNLHLSPVLPTPVGRTSSATNRIPDQRLLTVTVWVTLASSYVLRRRPEPPRPVRSGSTDLRFCTDEDEPRRRGRAAYRPLKMETRLRTPLGLRRSEVAHEESLQANLDSAPVNRMGQE